MRRGERDEQWQAVGRDAEEACLLHYGKQWKPQAQLLQPRSMPAPLWAPLLSAGGAAPSAPSGMSLISRLTHSHSPSRDMVASPAALVSHLQGTPGTGAARLRREACPHPLPSPPWCTLPSPPWCTLRDMPSLSNLLHLISTHPCCSACSHARVTSTVRAQHCCASMAQGSPACTAESARCAGAPPPPPHPPPACPRAPLPHHSRFQGKPEHAQQATRWMR